MTEPASKTMSVLQAMQLVVTLVLAVFGYFLNKSAQKSEEALKTIQGQVQLRQEERAAQANAENLRLQLFTHVSSAIERKDPRQQQAAKALVIALLRADDELRGGLINALSSQAADEQIRRELERVASQERDYRQQEQTLVATVNEALTRSGDSKAASGAESLSQYYVDVFYCQRNEADLKSRAEKIAYSLANKTLKTRLRLLADSVNASPGYWVTGLQIRYNENERAAMNALQATLKQSNAGDFIPKLVNSPTPHYMSIFICS